MSNANEVPAVSTESTLKEVIFEISRKRLGATAVLRNDGALAGIITDGDLRRMLEKNDDPRALTAANILTPAPYTIDADEMATAALAMMKTNNISQLVVLRSGQYVGILHLHDLMREGII